MRDSRPPQPISVVQVHRQGLVRSACAAILARDPGIALVASAATVEEAVAQASARAVDVALVEGVPETIRAVRARLQGSRILALWDPRARAGPMECGEAGAQGFLPSEASAEALLASVRALDRSATPAASSVWAPSLRPVRAEALEPDEPFLPEREREILRAVAAGCTRERIARRLRISLATVRFHLRRACERLGAQSRAQAVAVAWRLGVLGAPEVGGLASDGPFGKTSVLDTG